MENQKKQFTTKDIKDIVDKTSLLDFGSGTIAMVSAMGFELFPLSESDLVDIHNEDKYGMYYAFSIPIPEGLVKESILLAKQSDNYLSRLVLKYPYIQLIVEYWIINKLYKLYLDNPKLIGASVFNESYQSFNQYLLSTPKHYVPKNDNTETFNLDYRRRKDIINPLEILKQGYEASKKSGYIK